MEGVWGFGVVSPIQGFRITLISPACPASSRRLVLLFAKGVGVVWGILEIIDTDY